MQNLNVSSWKNKNLLFLIYNLIQDLKFLYAFFFFFFKSCLSALWFLRCVWREKYLGSPSSTACPEERKPLETSFPGPCQSRYTPITFKSVTNQIVTSSANISPLIFSPQFQDSEFAGLSGGRVVRIAVNPDYQGVGRLLFNLISH